MRRGEGGWARQRWKYRERKKKGHKKGWNGGENSTTGSEYCCVIGESLPYTELMSVTTLLSTLFLSKGCSSGGFESKLSTLNIFLWLLNFHEISHLQTYLWTDNVFTAPGIKITTKRISNRALRDSFQDDLSWFAAGNIYTQQSFVYVLQQKRDGVTPKLKIVSET